MSGRSLSHQRIHCFLLSLGALLILLSAFAIFPSAARTDMRHIGVGDTIFVYEQNLDITGLRTGKTLSPPSGSTRMTPRQRHSSLRFRFLTTPASAPFRSCLGDIRDLTMHTTRLMAPCIRSSSRCPPSPSMPCSRARITRTPSRGSPCMTRVPRSPSRSFRPTWARMYHAGALYPATVDLVLTTPGGAQLTTINGLDFSRMNVSAQQFYTDDPGRPGPITFESLGTGTYSVQAQWHDPASFYQQAPDSNIISFSVGGTTISTGTTSPPSPTATITTQTTTPAVTITRSRRLRFPGRHRRPRPSRRLLPRHRFPRPFR